MSACRVLIAVLLLKFLVPSLCAAQSTYEVRFDAYGSSIFVDESQSGIKSPEQLLIEQSYLIGWARAEKRPIMAALIMIASLPEKLPEIDYQLLESHLNADHDINRQFRSALGWWRRVADDCTVADFAGPEFHFEDVRNYLRWSDISERGLAAYQESNPVVRRSVAATLRGIKDVLQRDKEMIYRRVPALRQTRLLEGVIDHFGVGDAYLNGAVESSLYHSALIDNSRRALGSWFRASMPTPKLLDQSQANIGPPLGNLPQKDDDYPGASNAATYLLNISDDSRSGLVRAWTGAPHLPSRPSQQLGLKFELPVSFFYFAGGSAWSSDYLLAYGAGPYQGSARTSTREGHIALKTANPFMPQARIMSPLRIDKDEKIYYFADNHWSSVDYDLLSIERNGQQKPLRCMRLGPYGRVFLYGLEPTSAEALAIATRRPTKEALLFDNLNGKMLAGLSNSPEVVDLAVRAASPHWGEASLFPTYVDGFVQTRAAAISNTGRTDRIRGGSDYHWFDLPTSDLLPIGVEAPAYQSGLFAAISHNGSFHHMCYPGPCLAVAPHLDSDPTYVTLRQDQGLQFAKQFAGPGQSLTRAEAYRFLATTDSPRLRRAISVIGLAFIRFGRELLSPSDYDNLFEMLNVMHRYKGGSDQGIASLVGQYYYREFEQLYQNPRHPGALFYDYVTTPSVSDRQIVNAITKSDAQAFLDAGREVYPKIIYCIRQGILDWRSAAYRRDDLGNISNWMLGDDTAGIAGSVKEELDQNNNSTCRFQSTGSSPLMTVGIDNDMYLLQDGAPLEPLHPFRPAVEKNISKLFDAFVPGTTKGFAHYPLDKLPDDSRTLFRERVIIPTDFSSHPPINSP